MRNRFYLEKLVITGIGVQDAQLIFQPGVNLIVGSSDTGKSYIYQCIDYLLGSETCPKDIPESRGYSEAYLQIKTADKRTFTIFRKLKEISNGYVTETVYEKFKTSQKRELGQKNGTRNGENISEFLLDLMGVRDVRLKMNANNKTRLLSFRDIARLTLIDETRVITEGSPVYTAMSNYYEFTVEKSAFRYLLTENLDNELIEKEEKKIYESRIKGKMELIKSMVNSKNELIEEVQKSLSSLSSEEINSQIVNLLDKLKVSTARIGELTTIREPLFKEIQKLKSSVLQSNELLKRFYLLKDHYSNDLERLNFILEGNYLFEQLIAKDCPVCGTHMDAEHLECLAQNDENESISESVRIEGQKIELKLKDLSETILSTEQDSKESKQKIHQLELELSALNDELQLELLPLQENFQSEIAQLMKYNKSEQEIISAKNDITKLFLEKELLDKELESKAKPEEAKVELQYSVLKAFANHAEMFLRNWDFLGLTTVEFNSHHRVFDLNISGRARNSHGKGVRAISYSAFTFGLLDYCIEKSRPHSGFILIDSPLTTYHKNQKREEGDEVEINMQDSFFQDLKNVKSDRQIIILDNKIPPNDVISSINYIQFGGLRKGFFPS